jgi:hypothetical protein
LYMTLLPLDGLQARTETVGLNRTTWLHNTRESCRPLSCNRRRFARCGSCGVGSPELGLEG